MSNVDYKSLLQGKSYDEQLGFYKDLYDSVIQFEDYYNKMFPAETLERNRPCKLHDENITGKSFAYSKEQNLWTCFGSCHTSGRVTHFHMLFRKKTNPTISLLKCLEEIHELFSFDIKEIYRELPFPKIYKGVGNFDESGEFKVPLLDTFSKPRINYDEVDINFEQTDSSKILGLFMTKSIDNKHYVK